MSKIKSVVHYVTAKKVDVIYFSGIVRTYDDDKLPLTAGEFVEKSQSKTETRDCTGDLIIFFE